MHSSLYYFVLHLTHVWILRDYFIIYYYYIIVYLDLFYYLCVCVCVCVNKHAVSMEA